MKKFYLIHGLDAWPNGGWRPWLMNELYKKGIFSVALEMPSPKQPKKDEWVEKIREEVGTVEGSKYLVGHSLGVPAILRYLETLKEGEKIGGVFLVAGPYESLHKEKTESHFRLIDNFFEKSFDFEKIKKVCDKFYIIHNTFDMNVPFEHAEYFSKNLNTPIIKIERKEDGHLGDIPYCDKLPELLEAILKELN